MDTETFNLIKEEVKEVGIANIINKYYHGLKMNKVLNDIPKCRQLIDEGQESYNNKIIFEFFVYKNKLNNQTIEYMEEDSEDNVYFLAQTSYDGKITFYKQIWYDEDGISVVSNSG